MRTLAIALLFGGAALASSALAEAPRAVATFESIGLYWKPGTAPASGCDVRFRRAGEPWRRGLPMWFDARDAQCRGSLVQLSPDTAYEIELTAGGARATLSARTWKEAFPVAKAVAVPASSSSVNITEGGTARGYVVYDGGGRTLDAANGVAFNISVNASYVIVRNFVLKGAQQDGIRIEPGQHDVVIEDNDISDWGRFRYTNSAGWKIGMDMDSAVRARCPAGAAPVERVVIQRNRIHDPRYGANSWSWGHPAGPQGITFSFCGGNHVIRHNEITSDDPRRYFNDGIGGEDNFSAGGFPNRDSDIYGNIVRGTWDDGIEAEGGNANVRIWGNYLDLTATGIASTVTHYGPLYIFRNVYNRSRKLSERRAEADDRGPFAKAGTTREWGGGRRYLFHNTLLQPEGNQGAGVAVSGNSGEPLTNTVTRNNIWQLWKPNWDVIQEAGGSGNDFDYDLYNARMPVAGAEKHGIRGVPPYEREYRLGPASPGVDAGVAIPNFNDGYRGSAPDIGAHEAGTPPLVFGVPARVGVGRQPIAKGNRDLP
jgi:hypothetical protein